MNPIDHNSEKASAAAPADDGPIAVLVVDDQELVRSGFAMVIDSQTDMMVVGEAGDGHSALKAALASQPDIVMMDVRMPGMDGIAATEQIVNMVKPPPKVIILTTFDLDEYLMAAIRAGASGFLLKDAPPDDMLTAIRTVHAGDAVIAPAPTKRLIASVAAATPPDPDDVAAFDLLTEREIEVLLMMAQGLANGEIAAALHVAETTVKTHVGRILMKLEARDRVQAVVAAYRGGLVQRRS
ncbi:MAG: response regulator transcription factor [Bifidobacteriaceae bacterium]|jgi:DNA-binding NarL/FixJ family response regulator|nr:response regulator transcription factor [Bifidobacteriaceae bacterium]